MKAVSDTDRDLDAKQPQKSSKASKCMNDDDSLDFEESLEAGMSKFKDIPKKLVNAENDMFQPCSDPPPTSKLLITFARLAIPNILTNLLQFLSNVVIQVFAGHTN